MKLDGKSTESSASLDVRPRKDRPVDAVGAMRAVVEFTVWVAECIIFHWDSSESDRQPSQSIRDVLTAMSHGQRTKQTNHTGFSADHRRWHSCALCRGDDMMHLMDDSDKLAAIEIAYE